MSDKPVKRLSKKRVRQVVELEEEDGKITQILIIEMNGTVRDAWLGAMASRTRFDGKGNPVGVKNFDGQMASLIAACAHTMDEKRIGEEEIQRWPASTQRELFDLCQQMNGLTQEAAEAVKKD